MTRSLLLATCISDSQTGRFRSDWRRRLVHDLFFSTTMGTNLFLLHLHPTPVVAFDPKETCEVLKDLRWLVSVAPEQSSLLMTAVPQHPVELAFSGRP